LADPLNNLSNAFHVLIDHLHNNIKHTNYMKGQRSTLEGR